MYNMSATGGNVGVSLFRIRFSLFLLCLVVFVRRPEVLSFTYVGCVRTKQERPTRFLFAREAHPSQKFIFPKIEIIKYVPF